MFGFKRKKDEESVGLAGLGTGGVSPSFDSTPTVNVTAQPVSPQNIPMPAPPMPAPPTPAPEPPTPQASAPQAPTPPATSPTPESPFGIAGLTPGMMPTNAVAMLGQIISGHGPVGELVSQIRSDPEAFRQRMMAQLEAAGYSPVMVSGQLSAQAGSGAPQRQPIDVIGELTKAADLHHKGVLTDAEFEAYKKKLLGE